MPSTNNASFVLNALSFAKVFSLSSFKDKNRKYKETLMSVKIDLQECCILMNKTSTVKKCSDILGKAISKLESVNEKKLKNMVEVLCKILKSFEKKKFNFRINSLIKGIALDKSFEQLVDYSDSDSSDSDSSSSSSSESSSSSSSSSSSESSSSDSSSSESSSSESSSESEEEKKKSKKRR
jgi:hypothetical protein